MEPGGAALVTGAGRGIGRGVALELARRGFAVHAGVRDPAAGEALAAEAAAEPTPGRIVPVVLDVTDLDRFEPPDGLRVLVNNAGVDTTNLPVEELAVDEWHRLFATNVFGVVELVQRCVPALRDAGGGVIANLGSAGVLVPMPFFAAYRASKAAVSALGETLRSELAPFGIRVVEVLPGPVATDMLAESATVPEAAGVGPYRPLAEVVAAARAALGDDATPVADAATAIVDALLDDDAPLRVSCDPVGASLLDGWRAADDETWAAGFLAAFTVPPA